MRYDPFYKAPTATKKPTELLFEFHVEATHKTYRCELRDHGEELGVEAIFSDPVELLIARRFDPRLDRSRPSRELAIAWAHEVRRTLEAGGVPR